MINGFLLLLLFSIYSRYRKRRKRPNRHAVSEWMAVLAVAAARKQSTTAVPIRTTPSYFRYFAFWASYMDASLSLNSFNRSNGFLVFRITIWYRANWMRCFNIWSQRPITIQTGRTFSLSSFRRDCTSNRMLCSPRLSGYACSSRTLPTRSLQKYVTVCCLLLALLLL